MYGMGFESYQYLSSLKPTDISLATSSALFGSACLILLVGLDDEIPLGLECVLFDPTCMVVGVEDFCSCKEGCGASLDGEGWITCRGLSWTNFGVLPLVFLLYEEDLGVFMVDEGDEDEGLKE